jgi:type IV secretory pathway VirB4 component
MSLAEYRNRNATLPDYLPWAALVGKGVVLNKDGSFQRTVRFRGPDLDSATPAELVGTTARLNNALRRLGSGWALFVEAQRAPAQSYPHSLFPDPVSALVDLERREQFQEEGAHFESRYFLTFVWLPPPEDASRVENWLYEGRSQSGVDPNELLRGFIDRTDRILQLVQGARAGARNANVSRRPVSRRAADRRPRAAPRDASFTNSDGHRFSLDDASRDSRRTEQAWFSVSLDHPRDPH